MMAMHDMINADRVTGGTSGSSTPPEIGLLPDVKMFSSKGDSIDRAKSTATWYRIPGGPRGRD